MTSDFAQKIRGFFSRERSNAVVQRKKLFIAKRPDLVYAIGDVHGCLDLLIDLERQIIDDAAPHSGTKLIVVLGDMIDRGPNSQQVIDHLLLPPPFGFRRVCLAGNHEQMLLNFVEDPVRWQQWLEFGGKEALISYGVSNSEIDTNALGSEAFAQVLARCLPAPHLEFLSGLPSMLATPEFVFVHAGLRAGTPLTQQTDADLLWIRDGFFDEGFGAITSPAEFDLSKGMRVVHGHIPADQPVVTAKRICIDTGACTSGMLSALKIDKSGHVSFISAGRDLL